MKIAFVHDWLNGMRGGEKVLESLLALYPDADIHTLFCEPEKISPRIRAQRIFTSPLQKIPGATRGYRNLLPLFPWALSRLHLRDYDLVISISHCVAKSAVACSPTRHLCYCLSPMRYLWTHYQQYEERSSLISRTGMRLFRDPLKRWDRRTSARAGKYVAISRAISARIKNAYGREASVVYPPVDTEFFTPGETDTGHYYLAVSSAVPYKRLDLVVKACNALRQPLKVVGGGPGVAELRAMAGTTVEVLGWVSNEALRNLYRGCSALFFPPEEDFGIAPLEAHACGKPVLAYGRGGALETIIDGVTGRFFADQNVEALIAAIQDFDLDAFNPSIIRKHAEGFSTPRFLNEFRLEVERFLEGRPESVESSGGLTTRKSLPL